MAYRREDIEQVRAATDLVELIAEVTKVKRSGRTVMAICPFHQEKTPSMSVDGARGLYHCFGCGKSGDLFRWVQETQGLDFSDSLELLARRSGITLRVDPQAAKRRGERESLIDAVAKAIEFYQQRLRSGSDAGAARAYLRGRGYNADTVDRFQLGYSPASWDALVGHMREAKVPEKAVVAAGLASRGSSGRLIDRFRGRVMFPIFDLRGDPVGFGARVLEGDGPKYLNSPETPLYHKSRLLYGLNWAKSEIVRSGRAVVVEGYTDVIALHEAEMPVAVATCGTALGEDHFDLLRRFTEQVVLAFDADEAGAGASLRGFEHSVPGDLDLRVAMLPEGQDPADLVSAGEAHQLVKAVDESEPLLRFRLERELAQFNLSEPEARARAVKAGAAVVARHRDELARHEYAVLLARWSGVELDAVVRAVEQAARREAPGVAAPVLPPERPRGYEGTEQEVLRLLLANHPGIRDRGIDVDWFTRPEHRQAFELLEPVIAGLPPGEAPDLGALAAESEELRPLLSRLALTDEKLPDPDDLALRIEVAALDRRIDAVEAELKQLAPGAEGYSSRFEELIALQQDRKVKGGPR